MTKMTSEHFKRLADKYIADTKIHRKNAPRFVDKMPNNFMHVGLIHLMFPNAKIIDARRHPMACCFSNFKQLFADGQEFTYSLDDIARYYKSYVELMHHWDEVLPGKVHARALRKRRRRCRKRSEKTARLYRRAVSKKVVSIFTKPIAQFARQARNRCVNRSTKAGSNSGEISSRFSTVLKTSLEDEIAAYPT